MDLNYSVLFAVIIMFMDQFLYLSRITKYGLWRMSSLAYHMLHIYTCIYVCVMCRSFSKFLSYMSITCIGFIWKQRKFTVIHFI